jgi:IrrE N-terminal-like domain
VTTDLDRVADAVTQLRLRVPSDPLRRGPAPLAGYFAETALDHVELPALTRGAVTEYLRREGISADDLGDPADGLAGFVFTAGRVGWAFVSASDPLPRRRFSAAHELGHFVLHRATMGRFRADTDATLREAEDDVADRMEREANRFAAELLMPADVCRARAVELRDKHGCCPRGVLIYRLSSELLVSREALRYRLQALEVGDE